MYRYKWLGLLLVLLYVGLTAQAQEHFPYNGMKQKKQFTILIKNAQIHASEELIENGSLLIKEGKISLVGKEFEAPADALIMDFNGEYHLYPGFVELFSDYGMPEPKDPGEDQRLKPQMLSGKDGAYSWNEAIQTEFDAARQFSVDEKKRKQMLDMGITAALVHQKNGLSRGSAALVHLSEAEHEALYKETVFHAMSFKKGKSSQDYPSSLMGAIALLKQSELDAQWIQQSGEKDLSLERWNELSDLPLLFEVSNKWEALNALEIAEFMEQDMLIKGNNDEYQRWQEFKEKKARLILPLTYPEAMDISDPITLDYANYADMKHWELAPYNAFILHEKGIPFAFTTDGLKSEKELFKALRQLKDKGLSEQDILEAFTATPAQWLGQETSLGAIREGAMAHLLITNGNLFEKGTEIVNSFIAGKLQKDDYDFLLPRSGKYLLKADGFSDTLELYVEKGNMHWLSLPDSNKYQIETGPARQLSFEGPGRDSTQKLDYFGHFSREKTDGLAYNPEGGRLLWEANWLSELDAGAEDAEKEDTVQFNPLQQLIYPFQAFGQSAPPSAQENLVFRNCTVWTNTDQSILENADVWIRNGKKQAVGEDIEAENATEIDGTGQHLTSGIIDEHSHIAIRKGVNEGTQNSSAEVSIADVINPDDINIYRHLAGGVVALQQLHGSANPIGGQSSLIKLRWGQSAEEMKIKNIDGFIKFALGENVKQSNWGDRYRIRYPQTRMGVEQVYEEYFTRAREYEQKMQSGEPYRKDLELEAILEILNKERFITCHSYQQGEINMLMKLAERYNFRINTFTHVLEGYKIADKLAAHGAGASSFSDWWAYKYEVIDAIPYNAAILERMGVVTALNSDDAEMGRRLNQEAAKAVKYGGVSEEAAWKMVTLNPAKLLHIDDRTGTIAPGMDADLVLWSHHPLSSYARAERTFVDGIEYYNLEQHKKNELALQEDKRRLAEKMSSDKGPKKKVQAKEERHYHCDDIHDELKK